MISKILNFLNENGITITILFAFIGFIISILKVLQYWNLRTKELKVKRFKIYHDYLIRNLVQPDTNDGIMKLDRQIAIIYELKNFPEYYDVSIRILKGLKKHWKKDKNLDCRIFEEIDLSIKSMEKNFISRFLNKKIFI
ncbi:MAG: hypothetical protein U9O55_04635 [Patescibacteria group bacterium]|nr:hypothetical protein [Patescibacteria group bacterium]